MYQSSLKKDDITSNELIFLLQDRLLDMLYTNMLGVCIVMILGSVLRFTDDILYIAQTVEM